MQILQKNKYEHLYEPCILLYQYTFTVCCQMFPAGILSTTGKHLFPSMADKPEIGLFIIDIIKHDNTSSAMIFVWMQIWVNKLIISISKEKKCQ